ncbi:MAG: 1-acyl-sn-glycerol-3-phosphate acyltransferase [Planctomycetes bacterium]|nr:1-acyl-sn-glycerol-3-phosphate acyltransferase [Planctomycetota bacterium]
MLGWLRVGVRLGAVLAVMVGLYSLWNLGRPFAASSAPRSRAWRDWIYVHWARATARAIGMRRSRRGPLPTAPGLLVANHLGYVDVLLLAAETGAVFVSKAEVRHWPLIGRTATAMGTLYVRRHDKRALAEVNASIGEAVRAGRIVGFFPEGTSTDGAGLLGFRPSLFETAASSGAAVHCAALRYRTRGDRPPASRAVCWGDGRPFLAHALGLLALPGFDAEVSFAPEPLFGGERKELAQRAETRVRALYDDLRA